MMSIMKRLDKLSFKQISAVIGLVAVIIGAIVGGLEIVRQRKEAIEIKRQLQTHLAVGDRFFERYEFDRAIGEYEKALERDKDNIDAHRRIIGAMWLKYDLRYQEAPEVDDVLARIYKLQALKPETRKDIELLIIEARFLREKACASWSGTVYDNCDRYGGVNWKAALKVLEEAQRLSPDHPEVLAQIGFIQAWSSPKEEVETQDLIRAMEIQPNEPRYPYYIARVYEHFGQDAQALRYYYEASKRSDSADPLHLKIRWSALELIDYIMRRCFSDEGALIEKLDMPFEEQVKIFDYFMTHYEPSFRSLRDSRNAYMASLYYAIGDYENADREMRKMLDTFDVNYTDTPSPSGSYGDWVHWFNLHVKILEKSGSDPEMLKKARNYTNAIRDELERREKVRKYPTILEIVERRHRYKVGIQVSDEDEEKGLPVLKVFEGYPFSKAGVCEGDRILEVAHRKVEKSYHIRWALIKFDPGTEVPVKVLRGEDELFLTLSVE